MREQLAGGLGIGGLGEREVGLGAQGEVGEMPGTEFGEGRGGDHGSVVGGERGSGEEDRAAERGSAGGCAETGVRSHSTRDNKRSRADFFDTYRGAAE